MIIELNRSLVKIVTSENTCDFLCSVVLSSDINVEFFNHFGV